MIDKIKAIQSLLVNKPMCLFPRKHCNQTHIQSQLYRRQKMIFHNDKLIFDQNFKLYFNKFTDLRSDFLFFKIIEVESSVDYHFSGLISE
jgi:hypothetical protein